MAKKKTITQRRRWRSRRGVRGDAERPRLAFHKSLRHLYAQVIDDGQGRTLAHVTTDTKALRGESKRSFRNTASAKALGEALGAALKDKGIATVVFDRGGHPYHGVVKAFADAVRAQGIKF
ncbi:50S ribosomal protein L18 [Candidatus Sumerlaeota bacterium]|nr:50S ribosomal protein L18 [Candidatus Sumerlaeota bacterium]